MPKGYTETEKKQIIEKLTAAAQACLAQYGVRHTTVDELVQRAKIPKGTFYLFYRSKEELLLQVVLGLHDKIRADFVQELRAMPKPVSPDALADALCAACHAVEKTNLARILTNGELEFLMQKASPAQAAQHLEEDNRAAKELIALFPATGQDAEAFSAAFRAAFLLCLHREEIGPQYEQAQQLILRGIALQLLKGESE